MGILSGVGRIIIFILGLIFLLSGIGLTITIIGGIIGIPLVIIGLVMIGLSLSGGGKTEQKIIIQHVGERQIASVEEGEDKKKPKVKYCGNCGAKIKGKFCPKCGESV